MFPAECASQSGYAGTISQNCVDDAHELCEVGACCNGPFCNDRGELRCLTEGGSPLGVGVDCSLSACETGACCQVTGVCEDGEPDGTYVRAYCDDAGGDFYLSQTCVEVTCTSQCTGLGGIRPSDYDGDVDVDLADFAEFQVCFGDSPTLKCQCIFDWDTDGDLDLDDFTQFSSDMTGRGSRSNPCP